MSEFFECVCHYDEHTIKFEYDADDNQLYATVFLCQYFPWWIRCWVALKYALGLKCKGGHFDTWILDPRDAERLGNLLKKLKSAEVAVHEI